MSLYTIITGGASGGQMVRRDFDTLDTMKAYVERRSPMKRGWTSRWVKAGTSAWHFHRYNSKGRLVFTITVHG